MTERVSMDPQTADLGLNHIRWDSSVEEQSPGIAGGAPGRAPAVPTSAFLPTRPRAPTPVMPSTVSSSSSDRLSTDDSSEDERITTRVRRRNYTLSGSHQGLISNASLRRRAGPSSVEHEIQGQDHILNFPLPESPTMDPSEIFEPTPIEPVQNVLSVVVTPAALPSPEDDYENLYTDHSFATALAEGIPLVSGETFPIDSTRFSGHRDTLARLKVPRSIDSQPHPAPLLSREFCKILIPKLPYKSYLALRLTCRAWSRALTLTRPLVFPAVFRLPVEIVQQLYRLLGPKDFDCARRTCRAWMSASMDADVLRSKLAAGGWLGCEQPDVEKREQRLEGSMGEIWALSKRLATECSFLPRSSNSRLPFAKMTNSMETDDQPKSFLISNIKVIGEIDFTELGSGFTGGSFVGEEDTPMQHKEPDVGVHFTVSMCGAFLLVVDGCTIYVYGIRNKSDTSMAWGGEFIPVTSIACPRRVLAVSMDTSSRRYAVAALLDGRMGIVCDLSMFASGQAQAEAKNSNRTQRGSDTDVNVGLSEEQRSSKIHCSESVQELRDRLAKSSCFASTPTNLIPGIPNELGPRSVYRALCSEDDPPLSVAICPQRRCVAFGCAGGIELHWVDALTGQDLNRWFPLTAPSDYLYFLPPRRTVDSAKKIRLISSAGGDGQKGSIASRYHSANVCWPEAWNGFRGGDVRNAGDHCKAIPLSDGYHVLFTDTDTGRLFLGCDAPVGGPMKLIRRICLQGPVSGRDEVLVPSVYAAGAELAWGVRVAVAYGDQVWLFSVPIDMFCFDAHADSGSWVEAYCGEDAYGILASRPPSLVTYAVSSLIWPINLPGIPIGSIRGICDLAVDSSYGSVTIWAFSASGHGRTWRLDNGQGLLVRQRTVLRNGGVVDKLDTDGDIQMSDAPPPPSMYDAYPPVDLDGNTSFSHIPTQSCSRYQNRGQRSSTELLDFPVEHCIYPITMDNDRTNDAMEADEGYWSDDGGAVPARFDIFVPPIGGDWSEDGRWEWDGIGPLQSVLNRGRGSLSEETQGRLWEKSESGMSGIELGIGAERLGVESGKEPDDMTARTGDEAQKLASDGLAAIIDHAGLDISELTRMECEIW